ncbi:hypothetical protein FI667_g5268, partial [Globisporangium splendens]
MATTPYLGEGMQELRVKREQHQLLREAEGRQTQQHDEEPEEDEEIAVQPDALTLPVEPFPDSPLAKNRRELNEALIKMRRDAIARATAQGKVTGKQAREGSIPCSFVSWSYVQDVYEPRMHRDEKAFPLKQLSEEFVNSVTQKLLDEKYLFGSNMIGVAQDILMMDLAIAENESKGVQVVNVFGIVSTFTEWIFYKYDESRINYLEDSLNDKEAMIRAEVARIAGIVNNIMAEE